MSRMINRLCGRVYGWFDSKDARPVTRPLPAKFNSRSRLALLDLEDRVVPAFYMVTGTGDVGGLASTGGDGLTLGTSFQVASLRSAIQLANTATSSDTITFAPGFASTVSVIGLGSALPTGTATSGGLTITGPGAEKLIVTRLTPILSLNQPFNFTGASGNAFVLENLSIANFSGTSAGGAVRLSTAATSLTLNNVNITGNSTTLTGGGVYMSVASTLNINNSTFSGNFAGTHGGAIRISAAVVGTTISNSTFTGNTAMQNGGAISLGTASGTFNINSSTISGNSAYATSMAVGYGAGGIGRHTGTTNLTLNLNNTIVAGNSAANRRPDIAMTTLVASSTVNVGFSLIGANDPANFTLTSTGTNQLGTVNTPLNANLASYLVLGANGTQVLRPNVGSPAINNANPALATPDQRGLPRVATTADIGAVEIQATGAEPVAYGVSFNPTQVLAGNTAYEFQVTYKYDGGVIDAASISLPDDIVVTSPTGVSTPANIALVSPNSDNETITVTYSYLPTGGVWSTANNGTYLLTSVFGSVTAAGGTKVVPGGAISSFNTQVRSTFTVTNTGDNLGVNPAVGAGTGTLRQAIIDANGAVAGLGTYDTIVFDSSVFSTPQVINLITTLPTISDGVTITGPGSSLLTVQRGSTNGVAIVTFPLSKATGIAPYTLSGMTIAKGPNVGASGSAITTSDEIVTLNDVVISNFSTTTGGGAIQVGSNLTGQTNVGFLTVTNSVITGNTASGAINGAGIAAGPGSFVSITGSTISNNSAGGSGGGINFMGAGTNFNSLSITNSTLSGNTAGTVSATYGGGAINFSGGSVTAGNFIIRNSTIANNKALNGGGILIRSANGTYTIQNSTITANTATSALANTADLGYGGGGLAIHSRTAAATVAVNLDSTILSGNASGNVNTDLTAFTTGLTLNANYSAIGVNSGFTLGGGSGNNAAYGADLKLGALASNGGPTQTVALGLGSAALNLGSNPTNVSGPLTVDQRGLTRAVGQIDMGAFERQGAPAPTATVAPLNVVIDDTYNPYQITVTYTAESLIEFDTIGTAIDGLPDLVVTRTSGGGTVAFTVNPTLFNTVETDDAQSITANYTFVPPDGTWNDGDGGTYTVSTLLNGVKNTSNVAVPVSVLGTINVAFSGNFLVTNANDSGPGSLRQAIINANASSSADTITFDPTFFTSAKTINVALSEMAITNSVNITGPNPTTAKLTLNGVASNRLFNINNGVAGPITVTISNLTLTNGTAGSFANGVGGGAIFNQDELVNLTDCVLTANTSNQGGAFAGGATGNTLTLLRSVVSNNSATGGNAGGISMGSGGGVFNMTDSTVTGNAAGDGGGIGGAYGTWVITGSTISNNKATTATGGGIRNWQNNITISNSTLSGNSAATFGGALNFISVGGLTILNIRNSTITNNTAGTNGGGIARSVTTAFTNPLVFDSNIIAGNVNTATPDLYFAPASPLVSVPINGDHNLIGAANVGNFTFNTPGNNILTGTKLAPTPAGLAALASNGGLTQTHALVPNTAAVDAGSNIATPLDYDQRGLGYDRVENTLPDIGAYERVQGVPVAAESSTNPITNIDYTNYKTSDPYYFYVTYANEANIDYSSITTGADVIVTGPNGYNQTATFIPSVPPATNAPTITAKYSVPAPNSPTAWSVANNGTYTITAQAGGVTSGAESIVATVIDTFTVAVPVVFTVTNTNDTLAGSLRQAIIDANAAPGLNLIEFATSFDTGTNNITLSSDEILISDSVVIDGPGADHLTLTAGTGKRHFNLLGTDNLTVIIKDMAITGASNALTGGAILNANEYLTLDGVYGYNNKSSTNGGFYYASAAGSKISILNSTIANNSGTNGGAIYTSSSGSSTTYNIFNSTISTNTATTTGGAIFSNSTDATTTYNFRNSTFVGNSANTSGGVLRVTGATTLVTLDSSIVAGNLGGTSPAFLTATVNATNSVIDTAAGYTTGSYTSTATLVPQGTAFNTLSVGALLPNGGPMPTHAITASVSPLVNNGANTQNFTYDQRGVAPYLRVQGALADIGAFERIAGVPDAVVTGSLLITKNDTFNPFTFTVTYNDEAGIDVATVGNTTPFENDILVTKSGGGYSQTAHVTSVDSSNPLAVVATYTIVPVGDGIWDSTDNGSYAITPILDGVKNINNVSVPVTTIGTIIVNAKAPTATLNTALNVTAPGAPTYSFTVDYTDANAIEVDTIQNQLGIVTVTGPNLFTATITSAIVNDNTDGTPRTVTYTFNSPGGGWAGTHNGTYTIASVGGTVTNVVPGTAFVPAGTLGTFSVGIPLNLTVNNNNDSGSGSLRQAIIDANASPAADIITFDTVAWFNNSKSDAQRTIVNTTANGGPLPAFTLAGGGIVINGPTGVGSAPAFFDANDLGRHFDTSLAAPGTSFTINNLTLQNGSTTGNGGAILVGDEHLTLSNMTISSSIATQGGGIAVGAAGKITITDSTINGNSSTTTSRSGGGIYLLSGTGVANSITNTTISNNIAAGGGGGIFLETNTSLTLTRSTISGNTSNGGSYGGGGVYLVSGAVFNASYSTINNNRAFAGSGGGGIYTFSGASTVIVSSSTIANNTAPIGGGIRLSSAATLNIKNSTVVNNSATTANTSGGGINTTNAVAGAIVLDGVIVAGNSAAGVANDFLLTSPTANYSAWVTAPGGTIVGGTGNVTDSLTNFNLGTLNNNGGPTQTIAINNPSPLLNAGNPIQTGFTYDQRGVAPYDRVQGTQADIGAFERVVGVPGASVTGALPTITMNATFNPYTFTVTYADDTAMNASTIGNLLPFENDLLVTKTGGGYSQTAHITNVDSSNLQAVVATYTIVPTGDGIWDSTDNGSYVISTILDGVKNSNNISVPVANIGTIIVNAKAPTATLNTALNVTAPGAPTYSFTVDYTDANAIEVDTIQNQLGIVTVTGPNSFTAVITSAIVNDNTDGTPRTVTYTFNSPGGGWNGTHNGTYTIASVGGTVTNVVPGTAFVPAGTLGTFTVGVPLNLFVRNNNDSGPESLRQAIIDANASPAADIITFDTTTPGSYFNAASGKTVAERTIVNTTANGGPLPAFTLAGGGIVINGPTGVGSAPAFFDANDLGRHFDTTLAAPNTSFTFSNLTLTNASVAGIGGSINIGDENVTLTNMTFTNNIGTNGGAVYAGTGSTLTVAGSAFTSNASTSTPGGAALYIGTGITKISSITDTTFTGNSASAGGGAMFLSGANLTVNRSTFTGNSSNTTNYGGGAAYIRTGSLLDVQNSTFTGNTALGTTGGAGGGGAFYLYTGSPIVTVSNSTFVGNTATNGFGGAFILHNSGASLTVKNSTIVDNSATGVSVGSGIHSVSGSTFTLNSTVVARNSASGTANDINNLGTGSAVYSAYSTAVTGTGTFTPDGFSFVATPAEMNLAASLANNGGPTQTLAINNPSSLINAGNPDQTGVLFDQRNVAPYNRVQFGTADIGAYESPFDAAPVTPNATSYVVNVTGGIPGNPSDPQRSRIVNIEVFFDGPVSALDFSDLGDIILERTGVSTIPTGVVGDEVQTGPAANNHITVSPGQTGAFNSLLLTFDNNGAFNTANVGVENGSLSDGYWQLTVGTFVSTPNDLELRRLYGDSTSAANGSVDGSDLGDFGNNFSSSSIAYDFNNDGSVDGSDLGTFGNRFGNVL